MAITVEVNERGTLTLPKTVRQRIGLGNGGTVAIEAVGGGIILRPAAAFPIEIYSAERVAEFDGVEDGLRRHLKRKARR